MESKMVRYAVCMLLHIVAPMAVRRNAELGRNRGIYTGSVKGGSVLSAFGWNELVLCPTEFQGYSRVVHLNIGQIKIRNHL